MRSFDDTQGCTWQAALLEASYGNIALIFSPLRGEGLRQTLMAAQTLPEAEVQLATLDADGLRELLAQSRAWGPGDALI